MSAHVFPYMLVSPCRRLYSYIIVLTHSSSNNTAKQSVWRNFFFTGVIIIKFQTAIFSHFRNRLLWQFFSSPHITILESLTMSVIKRFSSKKLYVKQILHNVGSQKIMFYVFLLGRYCCGINLTLLFSTHSLTLKTKPFLEFESLYRQYVVSASYTGFDMRSPLLEDMIRCSRNSYFKQWKEKS